MSTVIRSLLSRRIDRRSLLAGVALPGALYLGLRSAGGRDQVAPSPLSRANPESDGAHVELTAILLSSSTCAGNTLPGFTEAVQEIGWRVQERAVERQVLHRIVGVATDPLAADGLRYLQGLGEFHEVVAGGGWTNFAAMQLMWTEPRVPAQVPQLLIDRRVIHESSESVAILESKVMQHLRSASEIVDWVAAGSPIEG